MILNDKQIRGRIQFQGMIEDAILPQISTVTSLGTGCRKVISYGITSFGYDARLARQFRVFRPNYDDAGVVDPKNFNPELVHEHEGDYVIIPPNSFVLGHTIEKFKIPRDILCLCIGKSTYARCGIIVNVTPLEPEWRGHVTMEISNTTPLPAKVYAGEGICQFIFLQGEPCERSYADKQGKYQDQEGVTLPRL